MTNILYMLANLENIYKTMKEDVNNMRFYNCELLHLEIMSSV